ncbi:hypothetical protein GALMADRAFT_224178 [Galerina marginata CBS 339.88]|uniref:Uncharacterized protein n=1 Tax=Galerina marginata (strain CBS 339.88) TaxID=685588 RepID=A0A067T725_GALM3|nr:hypothetical protein GALMADRAFT_224178 [Galerina marginata CBS 339.88]
MSLPTLREIRVSELSANGCDKYVLGSISSFGRSLVSRIDFKIAYLDQKSCVTDHDMAIPEQRLWDPEIKVIFSCYLSSDRVQVIRNLERALA